MDGRTELVVEPDQKFLADVGTTYPVTLAAAVTLPDMTDVWISNYGTPGSSTYRNKTLWVGTYDDGEPAPLVERAYLKFDTTTLANVNVSAATLSMRRTDAVGCGDAQSGIKAQRITAAWTDVELTWENQPGTTTAGESVANDAATCGAPGTMSWNLAAMAQAWAAGSANHGLMLRGVDETLDDGRPPYDRAFDSFNATNKPTLDVTYTLGSTPTVAELQISPATSTDGTVIATSLTPQLAVTVADTAGGDLTGQFEIEHDPAAPEQGTGQIWTGISAAVASGSQATTSVPAGKLADGWKIRWRARAANAATSSTSAWSDWQTATVDVPNPAVDALQVTPSEVRDGVTVATSLTPAMRATVTDPAAQPLRAEFEVEHDPTASGQGSGQIWTGTVDDVATSTQASVIIPDGKLADEWKVRWRVRAINTATTVGSPWSEWQAVTVDVPDPVSEPAVGALQVTPSEQVDGATVTPTPTPSLLAQVIDPAGKPLRAEVELEHDPAAPAEQGTGQIWTGTADNVPAGTQATITVPADTLFDGWKVRWRARAVSATTTSAWSDWQTFTVDVPKPTATALAITPSKVADGVTVTTTLTPALQATLTHPTGQTLRAEAEIEHDPSAPDGQGSGQIWAGSSDEIASGAQTSVTVPAGALADGWKVRWRLRAVTDDTSSAWSDWQTFAIDVTQPGEEPLAQTAGPVIRTDQSFSVAAWLQWDDKEGNYSVIEQRGAHQTPFRLGNTQDHGLIFTLTNADTADAVHEGVLSDVEPPVNEWFHLAGTYDAAAKSASLYLNGQLLKTTPISYPAWNGSTKMLLGAEMRGAIDNARVYQRALGEEDISDLLTVPAAIADASTNPRTPERAPTPQALPAFDYERMSLQKCEDERDARAGNSHANTDGWDKVVTYSSCWSRHLMFAIYEETEKYDKKCQCKKTVKDIDDFLNFDWTVVMHSYLGDSSGTGVIGGGTMHPRNVKVWTRVDNFWSDGNFLEELIGGDGIDDAALDKTLSLQLKVAGGSTNCMVVASTLTAMGTPPAPNASKNGSGTATTNSSSDPWMAAPVAAPLSHGLPTTTRRIQAAATSKHCRDGDILSGWTRTLNVSARPHPESVATTNPWAENSSSTRGAAYSPQPSAFWFCDLGTSITARSPDISRKLSPNPRTQCLSSPSKHIPGNWNAPKGTPERDPLTRIDSQSNRYNQNTKAKNLVCEEFFADRPRKKNGAPEDEWQQCDEYPFASTKEGGAYDHPQYGKDNFSVQAVLGTHNSTAGGDLAVFYARYRVLLGNKFWVAVQ
ncbi:DNRLRE domain-containing protein [Nonomuraea salmonea]|uniref:DNRLRE domain-containing protein n=1 Tax=Nonomuraea salmonea TaxID=46181 RepID=UPI00361E05B7